MAWTIDEYHALVSGRRRGAWAMLLRTGLWLLSVPYGWAMAIRNALFDLGWRRVHRANVPVISVGNLTLGGTGKTPCVEYICRLFRERELAVAILSRGYGAESGRNDEARVLEENLPDVPHLQGGDRVALAQVAVDELESELLVLDDGFQHRRLARDLDLVLIDATNPWGHGHLFPRGLLRESPRRLRQASFVLLTRCDQVGDVDRERIRQRVKRLAPAVPLAETRHGPMALLNSSGESTTLERVSQHPIAAFCGIGNPDAFQQTLKKLGAQIVGFRAFADHQPYTRAEVEDLAHWASQYSADTLLLTTQKDLVKLRIPDLAGRPLWALQIQLQPLTEGGLTALTERLLSIL